MEPDQKTQQKWEVLWYFVENTGKILDSVDNIQCGIVLERKPGERRFYSYPSRIHTDFMKSRFSYGNKSITKDWAGKICEDLSELGILGYDEIRAPRQHSPTPHYYLKPGIEPFLKVMEFLFAAPESLSKPLNRYFNRASGYIQHHLNPELIRYVLAARSAEMWRMVPILEWNVHEAPKVFEEYYQCRNRGGEQIPCSFLEYVLEMWRSHDQDTPFSLFSFPPMISLRLPVFPGPLSRDERMKAIADLNTEVFKEHPWLQSFHSGLDEHYARYEYEHWVLPILALIRASPLALKEFLFGDWKPYGLESNRCCCFTEDGTGCMQYPLFRLLFTAIGDLAMGRSVDHDRLVKFVRFRPDHRSNPYRVPEGHSALMEIDLANQMTVSYDGSFDTDHTAYGDSCSNDVVEFDEETNFTFSSQVEIRCFWQGRIFFAPDDIPALDGLFRSLRDGRTPESRYVFSTLSHPVQNMLGVYTDEGLEKESWFAGTVLQDLNRLLISPDLYSPVHFPGLILTETGKYVVDERGVEMGDWQYSSYVFGLMAFNRELLERAFPGIVPERKQDKWEKTHFTQS